MKTKTLVGECISDKQDGSINPYGSGWETVTGSSESCMKPSGFTTHCKLLQRLRDCSSMAIVS
jgi:hypothetical protein